MRFLADWIVGVRRGSGICLLWEDSGTIYGSIDVQIYLTIFNLHCIF